MKVFVGRGQSLWVVESKRGKVTRLPIGVLAILLSSMVSVLIAGLVVTAVLFPSINGSSGYGLGVVVDGIRKTLMANELQAQSSKVHSLLAKLQAEKDEARRLNSKLTNKLESLEGALGSVTNGILNDGPKEKKKGAALLKPATYLPSQRRGAELRTTINNVDRMVAKLRNLPVKFPVVNPMITSHFGPRHSPQGVGSSFHRGIDFSLHGSARVLASGSGTVQTVGYMSGYGLYIEISHNAGVVSRYAHLAQSYVRVGDRVVSGKLIGLGGSSGTSTGRHLHYEVLLNGRTRDPMLFLKIPSKLQFVMKAHSETKTLG